MNHNFEPAKNLCIAPVNVHSNRAVLRDTSEKPLGQSKRLRSESPPRFSKKPRIGTRTDGDIAEDIPFQRMFLTAQAELLWESFTGILLELNDQEKATVRTLVKSSLAGLLDGDSVENTIDNMDAATTDKTRELISLGSGIDKVAAEKREKDYELSTVQEAVVTARAELISLGSKIDEVAAARAESEKQLRSVDAALLKKKADIMAMNKVLQDTAVEYSAISKNLFDLDSIPLGIDSQCLKPCGASENAILLNLSEQGAMQLNDSMKTSNDMLNSISIAHEQSANGDKMSQMTNQAEPFESESGSDVCIPSELTPAQLYVFKQLVATGAHANGMKWLPEHVMLKIINELLVLYKSPYGNQSCHNSSPRKTIQEFIFSVALEMYTSSSQLFESCKFALYVTSVGDFSPEIQDSLRKKMLVGLKNQYNSTPKPTGVKY